MSTNTSPDYLRGISIPLQLTTDHIWTAESSYTQASPTAGVAVSDTTDGLVLVTSGEQATDTSYEIKTQAGGNVADRASFVWRSGSTGDYYGHDNYGTISDAEIIKYSASTIAEHPDAIGLPDGSVIVIYEYNNNQELRQLKYSPTSNTWTDTQIASYSVLMYPNLIDLFPCVTLLSDGSILVAHWFADTDAEQATIRTMRSTDDGGTWSIISNDTLRSPIDISGTPGSGAAGFALKRLRMASIKGQICLMASVYANNTLLNRNQSYQYASVNNGLTFELVDLINSVNGDTTYCAAPAVTVANGSFFVGFINTATTVISVSLVSAFQSINTAYSSGVTAMGALTQDLTNESLAFWTDPHGFLYLASVYDSAADPVLMVVSQDNGQTWEFIGQDQNTEYLLNTNAASERVTNFTGCSVAGRSVIIAQTSSTVTTLNNSLLAVWCGGYSAVNMPTVSAVSTDITKWAMFKQNWIGFYRPEDGTWTKTFASVPAFSINGMTITTTGTLATRAYYAQTFTTGSEGLIVRTRLKSVSGGAKNRTERAIQLIVDNNTTRFEVSIQIDTDGYAVYDGAGTQIGTDKAVDTTGGIEFIIANGDQQLSIWRRVTANNATARSWVNDFNGVTIPNGGTPTGNDEVKFGHFTTALTGTTETQFNELHVSFGNQIGAGLASGQANPEELHGAGYPAQGNYVYIDQGLLISTRDGFAYQGQTNTIATKYQYPISNILHSYSPTPRLQWRSAAVAAGVSVPSQMIPFYVDLNIGAAAESKPLNDLICINLENINFRDFTIERYDTTSTSWIVLATITNETISKFSRTGNAINWGVTGVYGGYFNYNDCKNYTVEIGTRGSGDLRRVITNSEGVWGVSSLGKQTILQLDEITGTEPTTGNISIIPNKCTVVISLNGETQAALAIRTTAQKTIDNDIRIGHLSIGHIYTFAPQYGRGRSMELETNTENYIQIDNTQRSRKLSNGNKILQIAWTDGIDISQQYATTPDLNYWAASDGAQVPIANYGDVPFSMFGIVQQLAGSKDPVVYLPSIEYDTGSDTIRTLNAKNDSMLCTIDSNISIDHILGDELQATAGEVYRVATITLREIE